MDSLKDFLVERADQLRSEQSRSTTKRDEWLAALGRLNGRIRDWLSEADPDGQFLVVDERRYPLREEGLGAYEAPGLSVHFGPSEIRVEPIARNVAGPHAATGIVHIPKAYGRVDIKDGLRKYMIFRVEKDSGDRWSIIEQDTYELKPFDRGSFEEAFRSLLE